MLIGSQIQIYNSVIVFGEGLNRVKAVY